MIIVDVVKRTTVAIRDSCLLFINYSPKFDIFSHTSLCCLTNEVNCFTEAPKLSIDHFCLLIGIYVLKFF